MKVFYYIKRIFEIPLIEKVLLVKGIFLCTVFVPIINFFPIKNYIWLLKTKPKSYISVYDKKYFIRLVRKAMRRIERLSLFRYSCLVKSITYKILLDNLGVESIIALGINNSQSCMLKAHAYVKVDNEVVYLKKRKFYEVYLI